MRFGTIKKLLTGDFPEAVRSWLPTLVDPLNTFMTTTVDTLRQGITIKDNMRAQVLEVTIPTTPTWPMTAVLTIKDKPLSVTLGSLQPKDGSTPAAVFSLFWYISDTSAGGRQIKYKILGLDTSLIYTATIIIQA